MPHDFIEQVLQLEGGEALLVNFADGLNDRSLAADLFQSFAAACLEGFTKCDESADDYDVRRRRVLNQTVFSPPQPEGRSLAFCFQYAAALTALPPGPIVTVATWQKLLELIPPDSELMTVVHDELDKTSLHGSDLRFPADEEMARVAMRVNQLGPATPDFRLSYCIKGVPLPVWITLAGDVDRLLEDVETDEAATRIRDWLGLGHILAGTPLFAFRSKQPLPDPAAERLCRPTAWDAINHYWFKHRHCCRRNDGWGRTLDLALAACASPTCDGGAEAVTPGPLFGEDFECRYLGRVDTPPPSISPHVLDVLLSRHGREPRSFGEAASAIEAVLGEAER